MLRTRNNNCVDSSSMLKVSASIRFSSARGHVTWPGSLDGPSGVSYSSDEDWNAGLASLTPRMLSSAVPSLDDPDEINSRISLPSG
jgi:hypothetical protein